MARSKPYLWVFQLAQTNKRHAHQQSFFCMWYFSAGWYKGRKGSGGGLSQGKSSLKAFPKIFLTLIPASQVSITTGASQVSITTDSLLPQGEHHCRIPPSPRWASLQDRGGLTAARPSDWTLFKVCTICAALIRHQFLVLPLFHENLSLTQPALEPTFSHSGTELSNW